MLSGLIAPEFWSHAVGGALVSGALFSLVAAFREKDRIWYRFKRNRRIARGETNAHLEPEEYQGYLAHSLTEEERTRFPVSLFSLSFMMGLLWASWQTDNEFLLGTFTLVVAVYAAFSAFMVDRREAIEVPDIAQDPEGEEKETHGQTLFMAASSFLMAAFAVPEFAEPLLARVGVSSGNYYTGFWSLALAGLTGSLIWRLRDGMPSDLEGIGQDNWKAINIALIAGSLAVAGGLIVAHWP